MIYNDFNIQTNAFSMFSFKNPLEDEVVFVLKDKFVG
jgi:hypothetical protein